MLSLSTVEVKINEGVKMLSLSFDLYVQRLLETSPLM